MRRGKLRVSACSQILSGCSESLLFNPIGEIIDIQTMRTTICDRMDVHRRDRQTLDPHSIRYPRVAFPHKIENDTNLKRQTNMEMTKVRISPTAASSSSALDHSRWNHSVSQIQRYVARFEDSVFQKALQRLQVDKARHSSDSEVWAQAVALAWGNAQDPHHGRAVLLEQDRHVCMSLLYDMVDDWATVGFSPHFARAMRTVFSLRRIVEILAVGLVLTRAQTLYQVILPGSATRDGRPLVGTHWFCELHNSTMMGPQTTAEKSPSTSPPVSSITCGATIPNPSRSCMKVPGTMDRRLYRLLYSPELGLQRIPAIAQWSQPQAAPLVVHGYPPAPTRVRPPPRQDPPTRTEQPMTTNTTAWVRGPQQSLPNQQAMRIPTQPNAPFHPPAGVIVLLGGSIPQTFPDDLHFVCGCSNFEPVESDFVVRTPKHDDDWRNAESKPERIRHLVQQGLASWAEPQTPQDPNDEEDASGSSCMVARPAAPRSIAAATTKTQQTLGLTVGHNELFREIARFHFQEKKLHAAPVADESQQQHITSSAPTAGVDHPRNGNNNNNTNNCSVSPVRPETRDVIHKAHCVAQHLQKSSSKHSRRRHAKTKALAVAKTKKKKARFRIWKPLLGPTVRRLKASQWSTVQFVEITDNVGHCKHMLEPLLRKARQLAVTSLSLSCSQPTNGVLPQPAATGTNAAARMEA